MVCNSSTSIKPLKVKVTTIMKQPKKAKPTPTMETTPLTAITFDDKHYRVSMLKSRFASTILKAQQQLSESKRKVCNVEKKPPTLASTPTPMEERREATREASWRNKKPTAMATTTPTTNSNEEPTREVVQRALWRKMKLPPTPILTSTEEIRRAARQALEDLERSVDVEDSHKSVKDLERLCGWPIPSVGGFKNRMEYYGLYLKNY